MFYYGSQGYVHGPTIRYLAPVVAVFNAVTWLLNSFQQWTNIPISLKLPVSCKAGTGKIFRFELLTLDCISAFRESE